MSFWEHAAVAACTHRRWLDDTADDTGNRTCAICEQTICVTITERLLKHTCNQLAAQAGHEHPFPEAEPER